MEVHRHAPGLRYRRILIPALAYVLAWGDAVDIDTAYRAVILLFFAIRRVLARAAWRAVTRA